MKTAKFFLSLLAIFICGCGVLYTEEQVNSTVVAKIREVAGMQKVNVTVQTVIVKEYVLITATPDFTPTAPPLIFHTATPLPFDYLTKDDVFAALTAAGYAVRQFYYELTEAEIGPMINYAKSSSKFTVDKGNHEVEGFLYSFDNEEQWDKAFQYLTSEKPGIRNKAITTVKNLIVEMDTEASSIFLEEISKTLSEIQ